MLAQWYASTDLVDGVIAFTVLELLALWLFHRRTGRGLAPADYALNGVAGVCLMVALRGALTPQWPVVALGLVAAGLAHGGDLVLRVRSKVAGAGAGP